MREESHLEDMRSAIRGDFARLAERRGDQELLRIGAEAGELEIDQVAVIEPDAPEPDQHRSWFARFLSP